MTDAEKILADAPAPNVDFKPGDGFKTSDELDKSPELDAEGQPVKVDERLANPGPTLEPVGWEAVLTSDGKPVVSSKGTPMFTAPDDHRKFFINESGQAETIVFGRRYTAKEALRIFDLNDKTIKAEEQALKNAEAQRKLEARRAAQNRA